MMLELLNRWGALRWRLRTGGWCEHTAWTSWTMADLGRAKVRHCTGCGWTEVT